LYLVGIGVGFGVDGVGAGVGNGVIGLKQTGVASFEPSYSTPSQDSGQASLTVLPLVSLAFLGSQ